MRPFYFTMAIAGALIPYVFFFDYIDTYGLSLLGFLQTLFANGASGGFAADLFISSFVFWIFMFTREGFVRPWPFIALNLVIGLSCALPAYLFFTSPKGRAV